MPIIETHGVTREYDGQAVLRDVSLAIGSTDVFTLIGPTGSGKTTLLRILDLLEEPSAGEVIIGGVPMAASRKQWTEARRKMAYVQQRPVVFNATVAENIAFGLRWRRVNRSVIRRRVAEALELVGMGPLRDRNARTLSGGETQRVAIARALATEPRVIFLDEPTANMDPLSTTRIEEVLFRIIAEKRTAIMMTTHNLAQGQRLASRLGVLIGGELMQSGNVHDIFNHPSTREVAEFVGVENIVSGRIVARQDDLVTISAEGQTIYAISHLSIGERVDIFIRPEVVVFSRRGDVGSARNVYRCTITSINSIGAMVRMEVECGFTLNGVITRPAAEELVPSIGGEIFAGFKATAIHVAKSLGSATTRCLHPQNETSL